MSLDIQPIDPASPTFIGEVSGIDLSRKLTDQEVSAIHAAMDQGASRRVRSSR